MSKKTKIWLTAAASFVFLGCLILGGVLVVAKGDFYKLSTSRYETNSHEIGQNFENVSVVTDTADVTFLPAEDGKVSVVCYEQKKVKHTVTVTGDTLVIKTEDSRKWYEYIGINFGTPSIKVYLPSGKHGALLVRSSTGDVKIAKDLSFESIDIQGSTGSVTNYASASQDIKIKTSTGNIELENISAGNIEIYLKTGKISVFRVMCKGAFKMHTSTGKSSATDVRAKNFASTGSTGSIALKNVIVDETMTVERSTGDVKFTACDAGEIYLQTDTGDVEGTVLTEKVFVAQSDTGDVDVPKTIKGGRCEISSDTGDIHINFHYH